MPFYLPHYYTQRLVFFVTFFYKHHGKVSKRLLFRGACIYSTITHNLLQQLRKSSNCGLKVNKRSVLGVNKIAYPSFCTRDKTLGLKWVGIG